MPVEQTQGHSAAVPLDRLDDLERERPVVPAVRPETLDRADGSIMHASVRIGDSVVMMSDGTAEYPAFPVLLHVYMPDVDETYARALEYGAVPVQAPSEKGDDDRRCGVKNAPGNTWWLATHVER